MPRESSGDWPERRREAAREQAARADRRRETETARACQQVAGFAAEARARRLISHPLLARSGERRGSYRTGLTGWYLTRDGSLGVTEDGEYYVLSCPPSRLGLFRGVHLEPADPPLQVGAGARDGESIALDVLLAMRLAAGDDWPRTR
ncbi:MAG: hypothetical protein IPJ14_20040 [Kineosporiaceae bacterium]|nr:hypothetical protein [Kineosporiaceae bacterium]MBK7624881.1 hypothetical protein [Kineosporiaceae bacterium]MBK8076740.1 hypothetical protein [Kineosporiaceae bacterium]